MSKRLVAFLCAVVLVASVFCTLSVPSSAIAEELGKDTAVTETANAEVSVEAGVLAARFENMLNHNFLYNDDFLDDKTVIENSILSLLEYVDNGEIDMALTLNFIANMYGREVDPNAAVYDFLPASEGKFAVIPRGYTVYSHKNVSVEEIDGGYLVHSEMTVNPHDDGGYTVKVESVFVPNSGSSFGFNLIKATCLEADATI